MKLNKYFSNNEISAMKTRELGPKGFFEMRIRRAHLITTFMQNLPHLVSLH